MPKYAKFDHVAPAPAPAPVTGWYNTDILHYPALPDAADLLEVTDEEWVNHMENPGGWAVRDRALVAAP